MSKFKPPIIPSDLPSPKQIAEKLKRELYYRSPEPEDFGHGLDPNDAQATTIPLHRFYSISERKRVDKHLYWSVEYEASRIGIIVGFGRQGVVVATDCSASIRWEQSS